MIVVLDNVASINMAEGTFLKSVAFLSTIDKVLMPPSQLTTTLSNSTASVRRCRGLLKWQWKTSENCLTQK